MPGLRAMGVSRDAEHGLPVASPCIRVCSLDAQGVCLGCFRTLTEISAWSHADETQRRLIVVRARARQSARASRA